MIKELLKETRSYRRYDESKPIDRRTLEQICEAVRFCPCAANLQRLRLVLLTEEKECAEVFETLSFAAYLRPWVRPEEGERPVAYAVIMTEKEPDVNLSIDIGIAAEAMLLTAREMGIGGCMFRSFNAENLTRILGKEGYSPILVLSFGYPGEKIVLEDGRADALKYYRDSDGVHHVPKLPLEEIILK